MATIYPIAEKNLLKIILSNRHVTLQAVNNKSGHTFCHASSIGPALAARLQLRDGWTPAQRGPTKTQMARVVAETFAARAKELQMHELTYERQYQPGGKQRYCGVVKACIDTLREHGIVFKQMAVKPGEDRKNYVTPVKGWKLGSWQRKPRPDQLGVAHTKA
ncbi:hypothetical protein AB1Y20_017885 [Prymnesium parvum]|uniref:Uncharacterized protein n=1 Tax=Prymnesium parvum TaxID=97485 RepID=A0AB34JN32_PRYPA|mmetsp:Transcript_10712/g.15978  ORF Transcript_10712/g.15978 Transcript_10712/m.15978 type:complete len:162 (+) Transcript_10712:43-528(+)